MKMLPLVDHEAQNARLQNLINASRGMLDDVKAELTRSAEKSKVDPITGAPRINKANLLSSPDHASQPLFIGAIPSG